MLKSSAFINLVESSVDRKIRSMQETIDKQEALIMDLQCKNERMSKDLEKVTEKITAHNDHLHNIDLKMNTEEQYSRRNCLRLFGYPEKPNENTDSIFIDVAKQNLKIDLTTDQIERSHRVGLKKEKPGKDDKPRGIIIKLKSYRKRDEIIKSRRNLKGTKLVIVEDLTSKNQTLLNQTRSHAKVKTAWSQDGRIIALLNEEKDGKNISKLIRSLDELALL